MITAQDLLTELGNRAWSGFNKDDMVFENEEAQQALAELNSALRYLYNLVDFPFKDLKKEIITSPNTSNYAKPDGQITNLYNAENYNVLTFIGSGNGLDLTQKGEPTSYWVDYKNPTMKLHLYPIPDQSYKLVCAYSQYKPVLTQDGEKKFQFENADDYMNMPELLEYLFKDCLILRTMATNNKDAEDENYQPILKEFEEAWRVFLNACRPAKINKRVCIWQ